MLKFLCGLMREGKAHGNPGPRTSVCLIRREMAELFCTQGSFTTLATLHHQSYSISLCLFISLSVCWLLFPPVLTSALLHPLFTHNFILHRTLSNYNTTHGISVHSIIFNYHAICFIIYIFPFIPPPLHSYKECWSSLNKVSIPN